MMYTKLSVITLMAIVLSQPAYSVLLDDDDMAAKPATKPKTHQKSAEELEIERLKKELAASKRKQNQTQNDRPAQSSSGGGPRIDMVRLPNGLLMGKYEVTQGQWRAVMGNNPSKFRSCGNNCPVEQVSWDDVQQFIQRLNSQTGKRFRLPSEDEWYAACQAGSVSSEYCGSSSIDAVAWYADNSGETTHAVGQKQPNAWGLYDMSGSVWEWTNSCYENDCSQRTFRGGSWLHGPAEVQAAYRFGYTTTDRGYILGFRLVQDP